MVRLALLIAAAFMMLEAPAHGQLVQPLSPAATSTSSASPQAAAPANATIGTVSEEGSDQRIASRITSIFAAVPALQDVTVAVKEGVVTLGGTAPAKEDMARAEEIARRVDGVVTVENGIERDLSVEESLGSIGSVADRIAGLVRMLPLIAAALLVAAAIAGLGYLLSMLAGLWRRIAPNNFLADLIASALRLIFAVAGIVVGLQMVGAGALVGAILGGAGIIGVALGFAMRDTIENYVASIMLSVRQPFRANDWVVIDTYEGRVIRLTSRATILMTLDGNHLRVPNSTVFKAVILNYTRNPQRRFDFDLGIDAGDDPSAARKLGVERLAALNFVLAEPPPSARVVEVGDSNIVLKFLAWIDQGQTDWYSAQSQAIPAVKAALEDAGFALPEPIYRLRFDAGAPYPIESSAGEAARARPLEPRKPVGPAAAGSGEPEDTGPSDVIAEMVERERQSGDAECEADLLDPRRPVE